MKSSPFALAVGLALLSACPLYAQTAPPARPVLPAIDEAARINAWFETKFEEQLAFSRVQEMRRKAEAALGARFDLRTFHDTVLGGGALPLTIIEKRGGRLGRLREAVIAQRR